MGKHWFGLAAESSLAELGLYVLAVAVVLWLCWKLSKYVSRKAGGAANTNNIRILERVNIAQDKGLVIAEICGGTYLLSFCNERVEILKELDPHLLKQPPKAAQQSFRDVMNSALKGRWDLTGNDRNRKNGRN